MPREDKFARFIGWARSSAFGHVVQFGLPLLVAEVPAIGVMAYLDGTLSLGAIVRLSLIYQYGELGRIKDHNDPYNVPWQLNAMDAAGRVLDATLGAGVRVVTGSTA